MGGDPVSLLAEARAAGLQVRVEGGRLVVRGSRRAEPLARGLLARSRDVLTVLGEEDAEVAWRVAAMRPEVPATGPLPILVARQTAQGRGCCVSCGDLLGPDRPYRCAPCAHAAWLVVNEVREGVGR